MHTPGKPVLIGGVAVILFPLGVSIVKDPGNTNIDLPSPVVLNAPSSASSTLGTILVEDLTTGALYMGLPVEKPGSTEQST